LGILKAGLARQLKMTPDQAKRLFSAMLAEEE
jgi:hypothetical protein